MSMYRRVAGVLATLAIVAVGLFAVPTAAHADTTAALNRCRSGVQPNYSETITQPGRELTSNFPAGVDPPSIILPGDVIKVTVVGSITPNLWRTFWVGPAGNGIPAAPTWPFAGYSEYSLVANWNQSGVGWIGGPMPAIGMTCVVAPSVPTRLVYFINDIEMWDNAGDFTIRTDLYYR